MNEPHENLDPDPFAHDAARRPSRLRRTVVRRSRATSAARGLSARPVRRRRPCPRAARGPLR